MRSRMSDRTWSDLIPNEHVRAELDFIAIRNREMLKAEGLRASNAGFCSQARSATANRPPSNASSIASPVKPPSSSSKP